MNWQDASQENPTQYAWYSDDPANPGHRYVIIKSKTGTGPWRLAFRANENQPLRIIYVAETQAECKGYAEAFQEQSAQ